MGTAASTDFMPNERIKTSQAKPLSGWFSEPHRVLVMAIVLGAIIFVGELVVMFLFMAYPITNPLLEAFIDATVLVTLVSPALYFLFYRPVRKRVELLLQNKKEIRGLISKTMEVSEEKERQLALDLHDEFGQTLSAMRLEIDIIRKTADQCSPALQKRCAFLSGRIDEMQSFMHNIAERLRPAVLDDLGIVPALESIVSGYEKTGVATRFELSVSGLKKRPPAAIETAIYRVAQEAINNALKYADAQRIDISLVGSFPELILVVRDDGCGFNHDKKPLRLAKKTCLGIVGMRERVRTLGGTFTLQSQVGMGTTLRAVFNTEEAL